MWLLRFTGEELDCRDNQWTPSKMFFLHRVKWRGESGTNHSNPEHPRGRRLYYRLQSFKHCFRQIACCRQDPGKSLRFPFLWVSNGVVKKEGRLTASLVTRAHRSTLHITASRRALSATDFCAVDAQWSSHAFSLYPNLQLQRQPVLQRLLLWGLVHYLCTSFCREDSEINAKTWCFYFYFLYCGYFLKK